MRKIQQRRGRAAGEGAAMPARAPGKRSRVQARYGGRQRQADDASAIRETAAAGVAGAGGAVPFADQIQASFGRHDVGSLRAHTSPDAQASSQAIGADAFAMGSDLVFAAAPDLHTAAHEAAHAVQQRGSLSLPGGVGAAGDRHEVHADRVADAVVQGRSAEPLLDEYGPGQGGRAAGVQGSGGAIEAPAPGEGGVEHPGSVGAKPFTAQEQLWIDEVLRLDELQLIFQHYELPVAVLHRVATVGKSAGQTNTRTGDIAIADKIYPPADSLEEPSPDRETDEESFKGTLLHELFHFIEHNAVALVDNLVLPSQLVGALREPGTAGFAPYAFGWFMHPVTGLWLHFQLDGVLPGVLSEDSPMSVRGTALEPIAADPSRWERSPMPVSGDLISAEEDLCESFSRYLASPATRAEFAASYPLRFQLLDIWFTTLGALRDRAAG